MLLLAFYVGKLTSHINYLDQEIGDQDSITTSQNERSEDEPTSMYRNLQVATSIRHIIMKHQIFMILEHLLK
jgi:hypothetical protein